MECSAERDQRLMQLVSAALQKPPSERESYLRQACTDVELLQEASAVIHGEEKMGSFLLHPAITFKDSPPAFQLGELVAGRFEIIRDIGEGGMGVVYEAFDRKLNRRVAIKSAKPGFQPRLSPEIRGALAVSHPSICRVNEIHTAHTSQGDVDFLTMELLEGETLSSYLKTHGKLPEPEAFEIARQICEGVAEAHRRGIIHRDLKSGNVILCRGENDQVRAVITDFGLAGEGTQAGDLGGTPRYIAPELWKGERASKASDIYALGVVLYEMMSGPRSQSTVSTLSHSDTNVTTASRSDQLIANARATFRGLPHRWARTISRCLSAHPQDRPSSATEVLAGLKPSLFLRLPLALRICLAVLPVLLLLSLLSPEIRELIHDFLFVSPSVRLVVLPASSSDGTVVVSGGALQDAADRISHFKAGQRTIAVIPPGKAQEMQVQTPEQAQKVFRVTHALQTAIRRDGQDLIVEGAVIDLQSQAHLRDFSSRYSLQTAGALPGALAGEVSSALNIRRDQLEKISAAATAAYDRGLYYLRLDVRNFDEAIRAFQEAAQLDPHSALPLAGVVEADVDKFDDTGGPEHLVEAQHYLEMAESLDPDSVRVHLAAGMLNQAEGQHDRALEEYRRVAALEPHNVYAFIRIAQVYDTKTMPEKAIENYRHAIELDPNFYDPHEYFGVFYFSRGRYSEAADEFRRVIALAPGMYNAYTNLSASLVKLGRFEDAEPAARNALELRKTPQTLNNVGDVLLSEHRFSDALPYLKQAAALTPNDYVVRLNLADTHRSLGHAKDARAECGRAMDLALSELSQVPGDAYARALVGYCAARLGDRRRAAQETGQALKLDPGNNSVIRRALLTYVAIGLRSEALAALSGATPDLIKNLQSDPELADFCRDPRFRELAGKKFPETR
jgi:eukaryotic-like serine/threonine-protein kinase